MPLKCYVPSENRCALSGVAHACVVILESSWPKQRFVTAVPMLGGGRQAGVIGNRACQVYSRKSRFRASFLQSIRCLTLESHTIILIRCESDLRLLPKPRCEITVHLGSATRRHHSPTPEPALQPDKQAELAPPGLRPTSACSDRSFPIPIEPCLHNWPFRPAFGRPPLLISQRAAYLIFRAIMPR